MLKILRRGAIDNPWFYRTLMGGIALAFFISMGWWGFDNQEGQNAGEVNGKPISLEAYRRAYRQTSDIYRQLLKDQYNDKQVRQQVIDGLVQQHLWLDEARRLHLIISDVKLRESLSTISLFQKDGIFDPAQYHQVLRNNRIAPSAYEQQQREQLLIEKAQAIIKESVALRAAEIKEAKEKNPSDTERGISDAIFAKKQRLLMAYGAALKKQAKINVKEEVL